jgi:hypothetical protein
MAILVILILAAFVLGYGPLVVNTTTNLAQRLEMISPLAVLLIGLAVGKFLL